MCSDKNAHGLPVPHPQPACRPLPLTRKVVALLPPLGALLTGPTMFAVLILVALTANAAPPITETFRNSTATGWVLSGSAILTSGVSGDAVGDGWLRLTAASGGQAGSAIYNTAFSSTSGVQATFSYATYGGTGNADGISFYLIDGSTGSPTVGAPGGGLGYGQRISTSTPGVTNGYLGVGLDEFGNFVTSDSGGCAISCVSTTANSVAIRGSGNLMAAGFNLLTRTTVSAIATGNRAGAKRVRITIPPGTPLLVTVEIDSGSGFVTVISGFNLTTAPGQVALPATFKMGLSASTGGSTNFHEIRDFVVSGATGSTTSVVSSRNPSPEGESVTFTATVTSGATGTVTFLDGTTVLGTGTLSGTTATFTTSSLTAGTHSITARYEGDSTFGSSTSSAVSQEVVVSTGIPTLSEWGQIGMAGLLVGGGLLALRRNRPLS